jgi:hypothetical protein
MSMKQCFGLIHYVRGGLWSNVWVVGLTWKIFAFREGGGTVGARVVSKVIGWNAGKLPVQFFVSSHLCKGVKENEGATSWRCMQHDTCWLVDDILVLLLFFICGSGLTGYVDFKFISLPLVIVVSIVL